VSAYHNLQVINADTGSIRSLPLPAPPGGSSDLSLVKIGTSLLLNRGNTAWLYRPGLQGPPLDLGPSLRTIPGPTANEAWIWSDPCAATVGCFANGLQQGEVRLVDTSGRQVGQPIALPADATWFPTGQVVSAGLILAVASIGPNAEEIWNPISNRVTRILPRANVFAASGDLVASTNGSRCLPHCTVDLMNVQTGIGQSILLPTDVIITGGGTFSPNGSTLALAVGIGGSWPQLHPTAVALLDVRTPAVRLLPGTREVLNPNYGSENVSWSSSGRLFAAAIGGTSVLSWRPGTHRATVLPNAKLPVLSPKLPPQFQSEYPTLIAM
jgi:hypothetical protein